MRPLEIVLLLAVGAAVLLPVLTGGRPRRGRMAALLLAALILQLVWEGHRWQLLPLEVTAVGLAVGDALREERRLRGIRRLRRGVLGSAALVAVAVLPVALPVPRLPDPTGSFPVGTRTFLLVDEARQDPYGSASGEEGPASEEQGVETGEGAEVTDPRRLVVQAWYPAEVPAGRDPQVWNADFDLVAPALSRSLGLPGFFLDHTASVPSHSHPDAPVLSGRLPVVIYAHGWGGFRGVALNQVESLASHGYLVLAADHTPAAVATRFPDGEVARLDPAALPSREEVGEDARAEAAELLVATVAADVRSVLDALEAGRSGAFGVLADHADLDLVGMVGHSVGGGAVVRACLEDERCSAVVGLDPWVEPIPDEVVAVELDEPSLFLRSDEWRGTPNDRRLRGLAERSPSQSYWVGLEGSRHSDLVMTPLLSPFVSRLGLWGPADPDLVVDAVDEHLHAFFDRHLLGVGGAVLDDPPPAGVTRELIP